MSKYKLHSRGENWFHFRIHNAAMGSFSITYCHDGATCMTGDMGCLTWQREYFPKMFDYGFPYAETGIGYFAEKIVRAEEAQKIKHWDAERARHDISEAICEGYTADDMLLLSDVLKCLESGEYGRCQLIDTFQERSISIEGEDYCEFGVGYTPSFIQKFELVRSVSDLILQSVGGV